MTLNDGVLAFGYAFDQTALNRVSNGGGVIALAVDDANPLNFTAKPTTAWARKGTFDLQRRPDARRRTATCWAAATAR